MKQERNITTGTTRMYQWILKTQVRILLIVSFLSDWRVIEGAISFVTAMNVPFGASKVNFAPGVNSAGGGEEI